MSEVEEKNKALARRFLEAQANADLDTLDELLAPDFVDHNLQPDQEPGREGFIRAVAEQPAIFSNVRFNIEDQAAEGDKVISRLTISRTHDRGEFLGLAPTGMEIKTTAIVIDRIVGAKIVEEWNESTGVLEATRQRLEQERIERERVEQEMRVARRIQQASLPEAVPQLEGWQITPYYRPAREVGGDFYNFHLLSEGRLGVVVGDATGKGVPAALVMTTTCGMLQAVSQALATSSPGEVPERVNETQLARIPANMFVTCFYCILEPESGSLLYGPWHWAVRHRRRLKTLLRPADGHPDQGVHHDEHPAQHQHPSDGALRSPSSPTAARRGCCPRIVAPKAPSAASCRSSSVPRSAGAPRVRSSHPPYPTLFTERRRRWAIPLQKGQP